MGYEVTIQATAQNKVIKHFVLLCIHAIEMFNKLCVSNSPMHSLQLLHKRNV
jgi:hypothetical protein